MQSKMQEKFGNNVEFIEIVAKKSFIKNILSDKMPNIDKTLYKIEEKLIYNHYGL